MPLLTTQSARSYGFGKALQVSLSAYESIQTVSLSSNQTGVVFSSIPSTFKHLQIRCLSRDDRPSTTINNIHLEFNGDNTTSYAAHFIRGNSSSGSYAADTNADSVNITYEPAASSTTGVFATTIYDILDYSSTSKFKTVRSLGGYTDNGSGNMVYQSGSWRKTDAINSIKLYCSATRAFVTHSSFALYGIKG
jgi:hypothetical protein